VVDSESVGRTGTLVVLFVLALVAGIVGGVALGIFAASLVAWVAVSGSVWLSTPIALGGLAVAAWFLWKYGPHVRVVLLGMVLGIVVHVLLSGAVGAVGAVVTAEDEVCMGVLCSFPFLVLALGGVVLLACGAWLGRSRGRRRRTGAKVAGKRRSSRGSGGGSS